MPSADRREATLVLIACAASLPAWLSAVAHGIVLPVTHEAQYATLGIIGEIALTASVNEIEDRLHLASPAQAQSLLTRIGVEPEIASVAAQQHDQLQTISLTSLPTLPPAATSAAATEYALLFLPQAVQGNAAMYLLSRTAQAGKPDSWRRVDGGLVNQFINPVSFELVTLYGRMAPLLLVHHVNVGHGSNLCKDQAELFSFSTGKLTQLLHTPDYAFSEKWVSSDETRDLEERSTFLPLPDGTLEETRLTTIDAQPEELARRRWHWQRTLGRFTPDAFQPVRAR